MFSLSSLSITRDLLDDKLWVDKSTTLAVVSEEGPQVRAPVKDNITLPLWFACEIKKSY